VRVHSAQQIILERSGSRKKKNSSPPLTIVTRIAGHFVASRTIPIMPRTRDAGKSAIRSSPPRAATGLPQPNGNIISTSRVTNPATSVFAAARPNLLFIESLPVPAPPSNG